MLLGAGVLGHGDYMILSLTGRLEFFTDMYGY